MLAHVQTLSYDSGFIVASVGKEGLRGGIIDFPKVSVGATESAIMTAVLSSGQTIILNSAKEPEIVDLGKCLIKAGAKIEGLGTNRITINGVKKLNKVDHCVVSDRIEAGSFAVAASITMGNVEINNVFFISSNYT